MSLATIWGYTLAELTSLPDLLTTDEFNAFTANKYSGDARISSEIASCTSAIRAFCGWHLYPSADCDATFLANGANVSQNGRDILIQLPARFVTAVDSVTVDGTEVGNYTFESNGLLRLYDVSTMYRYSPITIEYTAGLGSEMIAGIKELVAHQVTHALASSYGITSESAGGVSITYNSSWANNTRASGLSSSDKEVLTPYRAQGVF